MIGYNFIQKHRPKGKKMVGFEKKQIRKNEKRILGELICGRKQFSECYTIRIRVSVHIIKVNHIPGIKYSQ